ncbi:MAG: acyl-CoA carboxylase subunit beta, partial [Candidatus Dormibacteraeota bacterium]|nr:acyl-CoA carboxylase subunit beta [Candidatus Dormibacteraeota bacterium]
MSADADRKPGATPDDDLRRRIDVARAGGDPRYHAKLKEQGKLFVRDRLDRIMDPGWSFEDGLLARHVDGNLPADGVVTVVGHIGGRPVCVIANDMTVKAGTWGLRTFQKMTAMQELAGRTKSALLYLVDSAGARIDEQRASYAGRKAWGNIFYNQIQLSGVVPQVCVLLGPSPAGTAYQPALCDVCIMVAGNATAYIGSPRMSEMATGEKVTMEEMGGAEMHARISGLGDFLCATEDEALAVAKQYLSYFPGHWSEKPPMEESRPPAPGKSIAEIVPTSQRVAFNMVDLIKALVDADSWLEVKKLWARELVTGYARLGGRSVGIVANQSRQKGGVLFPDSS